MIKDKSLRQAIKKTFFSGNLGIFMISLFVMASHEGLVHGTTPLFHIFLKTFISVILILTILVGVYRTLFTMIPYEAIDDEDVSIEQCPEKGALKENPDIALALSILKKIFTLSTILINIWLVLCIVIVGSAQT